MNAEQWLLSAKAREVAAVAISAHHAFRLDMDDPNGPLDEDYEVAQAVLVAIVAALESVRVGIEQQDTK